MVLFPIITTSNTLIRPSLPANLVSIFIGGTAGIGEATLQLLAARSKEPRIYIVGRNADAGQRIVEDCRRTNVDGSYIFIQADISLLKIVDKLCEEIKKRETTINLLFLSAGEPILDRRQTSEGLHLLAALNFYSRQRIISNLMPLMKAAYGLKRVVSVAGGGLEGPFDLGDIPAQNTPITKIRGHLSTLLTIGLENLQNSAKDVSFIHDFPGTVKTSLFDRGSGWLHYLVGWYIFFFGWLVCIPLNESAERHLFLSTSSMFPPEEGDVRGVKLVEGEKVAIGTKGERGGGVYSVGWDCESGGVRPLRVLAGLRKKGRLRRWRSMRRDSL